MNKLIAGAILIATLIVPGFAIAQGTPVATTQNPGAVAPAMPVTCEEKNAWPGGSAYLIIQRLDPRRGTVDIDGIPAGGPQYRWGGAESNARWKYQGDKLESTGTKVRYRLTVGPQSLTGTYEDFRGRIQTTDVNYVCNGPIDRVIVH